MSTEIDILIQCFCIKRRRIQTIKRYIHLENKTLSITKAPIKLGAFFSSLFDKPLNLSSSPLFDFVTFLGIDKLDYREFRCVNKYGLLIVFGIIMYQYTILKFLIRR